MPNPATMRHILIVGGILLGCIVILGYQAVKPAPTDREPLISHVDENVEPTPFDTIDRKSVV